MTTAGVGPPETPEVTYPLTRPTRAQPHWLLLFAAAAFAVLLAIQQATLLVRLGSKVCG